VTYAPITDDAAKHFGASKTAIGWLAQVFPLVYVLLAVPAWCWTGRCTQGRSSALGSPPQVGRGPPPSSLGWSNFDPETPPSRGGRRGLACLASAFLVVGAVTLCALPLLGRLFRLS
jgi:hypothetical protein